MIFIFLLIVLNLIKNVHKIGVYRFFIIIVTFFFLSLCEWMTFSDCLSSVEEDVHISVEIDRHIDRQTYRAGSLDLTYLVVHWSNHHYYIRASSVLIIESTDWTSYIRWTLVFLVFFFLWLVEYRPLLDSHRYTWQFPLFNISIWWPVVCHQKNIC